MSRENIPMTSEHSQPQRRGPQDVVAEQVPTNRRDEIRRYLELFGYKPERSILQVHAAGSFGGGKPKPIIPSASGGRKPPRRTFTVLGRTHDPSLAAHLIPPR